MPSLTRDEALTRAALITVTGMEVHLDLDRGPEHFRSRSTVTFSAASPGVSTFVDVRPVEVHELTLNGSALPLDAVADGRLELTGLAERNVLVVDATMAYSHHGQGLHRSTDPVDGEDYVYGHLFLDAAPLVFGCFDQPDLKCPYAVRVIAPEEWTVVGNGAAHRVGPGEWSLDETPPLAPYFVTVCAGPYVSVLAEHDGVPLGIHGRASLEGPLRAQADQMLEVTRASLDEFHRLFGIRYAFGEYHQVFVPEFNAGAMENPGCVTIRDTYLFRGAATRDEVLTRTDTISHEMAHMWFGDLVTVRWWDDLWLSESFAEYMAHRVCVSSTEFTDAWVDATMARKMWGYAAERTPSTHPVAGSPADDTETALGNFDGISYAKGAAVLRQLIAFIGDDAFLSGVRAYLSEHAFGNGTLSDFLAAMERASGKNLKAWSRAWLETAGVDVIGVDAATGRMTRTAPPGHPADRPHALDVAGFTGGREVFRVDVRLTAVEQVDDRLADAGGAALVVPNASDLTWATVELDDASLDALAEELPHVVDEQARAVAWVALVDGVALGRVDPRRLVSAFAAAWPAETNESILGRVARQVTDRYVPTFLPPDARSHAVAAVADAARRLLDRARPGSGRALVAARTLARTTDDAGLLRGWAHGRDLPAGLTGDSDFRWLVVRGLTRQGYEGRDLVESVRADDDSLQGRLSALTAGASMPDASAKEWAWSEMTTNRDRSNYELNALAEGFWSSGDVGTVRPYVRRYFAEVPAVHAWLGDDALARFARLAYPSNVVEEDTLAASREALARADLTPGLRRSVVDAQSQLEEALRSRRSFDPR